MVVNMNNTFEVNPSAKHSHNPTQSLNTKTSQFKETCNDLQQLKDCNTSSLIKNSIEMKYYIDQNNINHLSGVHNANTNHTRHNQSAANLVASYGVYQEVHDMDDDDGFFPNAISTNAGGYTGNYPEMVVNTSGHTSIMPHSERNERYPGSARNDRNNCVHDEVDGGCAGWCLARHQAPSATQDEHAGSLDCCRPSVLLLILVVLIVIFMLVSGVLVYINYVAYRPKHSYVEEPCEKTFCAWGAQCTTGPDGRALCECPTQCRPKIEPVCGSDGRTYDNHCQLRVASCRARVNTKISYLGKCESKDPCKEKQCAPGSHCVASADGRSAICRCLSECPIQPSAPLCGNDGVDYGNECELHAASCRRKQEISVKYQGKCDPCNGVLCSDPKICQLDNHRNAVCRCGDICPLEFNPVCASDGKTYSNECILKQEGCRSKKTLHIIYRGKCSSGVNPCANVNCSSLEECSINKFGIARCECPPRCEPIVRPVCTEDGSTHASECEAKRAACLARSGSIGAMTILHSGVCGASAPCAHHQCHHGAICEMKEDGSSHCVCPNSCPAAFEPVCGTDGASYGNECKLKKEACLKQKDIAVLYKGPCDGCESKQCDFYSICTEVDDTARCVCPRQDQCNAFGSTVCGTDGTTYPNECALRIASCEAKEYILIAYQGDCDLCATEKDCELSGSEPVCATDGITYRNECELRRTACQSAKKSLDVVFYGDCGERYSVAATQPPSIITVTNAPDLVTILDSNEACRDVRCDHEATCELGPDSFPRCACRFNCTFGVGIGEVPICASDLRLYASACAMKLAACEKQEELRLRPLDLCQGMEVKPCNGDKPIIDPSTNLEVDCGNGPNRQDCPSGTYCHQTGRFARCCKKDQVVTSTGCEDTWFGCCPDGKTPSQGTNHTGCPIFCGCNKLGAFSESCDPETMACRCKPGVGGEKCDRCEPGYWGLPKISFGHHGCIPCGCSPHGSVREDCEQMTGRCVCKPEIQGQKCTVCTAHDKVLGPLGCVSPEQITGTEWPLRRYTPLEYTQSDDANSPLSKSTRHLMPDTRWYYDWAKQKESPSLRPQKGFTVHTNNAVNTSLTKPTPASKPITALLGDLCSIKEDCPIVQSYCQQGSCTCLAGYLESKDRQECHADNSVLRNNLNGYKIAGFNEKSYVRLKPLNAYHKLNIELEFKIQNEDGGILLYAQQHQDGRGDFVSLAANNGYIEFKYNLGDGPVTITSLERVIPGKFHRVVAKRYHRDGMLQLDDGENVAGQSSGKLRALDIASDTFIGYVPTNNSRVFRNIGLTMGLKGCIRKLRIGRKDILLWTGHEDVVKVVGITECSPNINEVRHENEKMSEIVSSTRTLKNKTLGNNIATFNGNGFIRLPTPTNFGKRFSIGITFNSNYIDGVLLYVGQFPSGKSDFVSIGLSKGRAQFRFNLGSGIANLSTSNKITLNHWHKIQVSRNGLNGYLQIDNQTVVRGRSIPPLSELNLGLPMYIGGLQSWKEVHTLSGITKNFNGKICEVLINGKPIPFFHKLTSCTSNIKIPCIQHVALQSNEEIIPHNKIHR